MILDLTVRIGKELEQAVADRDSISEPMLHLAVEEDLGDLMLIEVFLLRLRHEDNSGEIIAERTILAYHEVGLLALQGQDEEHK